MFIDPVFAAGVYVAMFEARLAALREMAGDALLVCATETKTSEDLDQFASALANALR